MRTLPISTDSSISAKASNSPSRRWNTSRESDAGGGRPKAWWEVAETAAEGESWTAPGPLVRKFPSYGACAMLVRSLKEKWVKDMLVGVPKEIKDNEYRVGLEPASEICTGR
jgi:hypothetical protein